MEKIKRNSSIINEINNNPYMIKSAYLRPSTKLEENQSKKSELKLITNFSVSDENTINNDTTESQSPRISNRKSSIFNLNSFFLSRILTGKKNMENSVTYNGSNEILIDMMKKSLLNINKKTSFVEKLEGINKNQILENVMNGKFSNDQLLDVKKILIHII